MSEIPDSTSDDSPGTGATDTPAVVLPEQFDLRQSAAIVEALLPLSGKVRVHADGVDMMTSPGLQVLFAAVKDGARELEFVSPSKGFLESLELMGCTPSDFGDQAGMSA